MSSSPPKKTDPSFIPRFMGPKQPQMTTHIPKFNTVGPGTYNTPDSFKTPVMKHGALWSFPKDARGRMSASAGPGPGEYKAAQAFGHQSLSSHRNSPAPGVSKAQRLVQIRNDNPPPCAYNPNIKPTRSGSPTFSFGAKPGAVTIHPSPAPGDYKTNADYSYRNDPKFSFGAKYKPHKGDQFPGPGQYRPMASIGRQISSSYSTLPVAKFGKDPRKPLYTLNGVPGPGSYPQKSTIAEKSGTYEFGTSVRESYSYMYLK